MLAFTSLPPPGNFGAFPLKNDSKVFAVRAQQQPCNRCITLQTTTLTVTTAQKNILAKPWPLLVHLGLAPSHLLHIACT
jgi:hypothetical protein